MLVSVITPTKDSEHLIPRHHAKVRETLDREGMGFEILYVDDGSQDGSANLIRRLSEKHPEIRGFLLDQGYGQEAAISVGHMYFEGDVCVSIDVDLQVPADIIPGLVRTVLSGHDYVPVHRVKRAPGSMVRSLGSAAFNRYMRFRTGLPIRDFGCGAGAKSRPIALEMQTSTLPHYGLKHLAGQLASSMAQFPVVEEQIEGAPSSYGMLGLARTFLVRRRAAIGLTLPPPSGVTVTSPNPRNAVQ